MHRSMEEKERTKKTTAHMREAHIRESAVKHSAAVKQITAHEKATVPIEHEQTNKAVTHSVGHSIERNKPMKGLRRDRY